MVREYSEKLGFKIGAHSLRATAATNALDHVDDFFMPDAQWVSMRADFFERSGLPKNAEGVPEYLTTRLNRTFDNFLEYLPENSYASLNDKGWQVSRDPAEKLEKDAEAHLAELEVLLFRSHGRQISNYDVHNY